ncbi:MAG: hypothetical protein HGA65_18090, partial [Oscillochloris sp.]|nr:hypothetical protein [Oscillochloris sp.]
ESISLTYANLVGTLSSEIEDIKYGKLADHATLARLWATRNDARSTMLLGDPAVHLQISRQPRRMAKRHTT